MELTSKKPVLFLGLGFVVVLAGFLATFYLTFRDVTRVIIEKQSRGGVAREEIGALDLPGNTSTNQEKPQPSLEGLLPVARSPDNTPSRNEPFVSQELQIANLRFLEEGYDGTVKEEAVYEKGDTAWLKFDIDGFILRDGEVRLSQDYYLYRADDLSKPYWERPKVLRKAQPWEPGRIVTFGNHGKVPPPGDYVLEIVVHDYNAGSFTSLRTPLRIVATKGKRWST